MSSLQEVDAEDLPLPPYPEKIGHPLTHSVRTMQNPLIFRDDMMDDHDVARSYFFGAGDIYNLSHPEHIKRVLVTDRDSFGKSDDFRKAFGEGLVATEGDQWKKQRQLLQPLFTQDRINSYISGMAEQINHRTESWTEGDTIDLQDEMRRLTLDTLFATLFGRELDLESDAEIHDAANHLHEWFSPTSYPLPDWVPTPARRRFKRGRSKLHSIADQLIFETASEEKSDTDTPTDLFSLLVSTRDHGDGDSNLTEKELRDQVITIVFAGHDTTASTLALALYELSRNSELRNRYHEEIDAIETPITRETLSSMSVTERIVKETLRLYPPVFVIPRITTEPVAIDGYQIPEDNSVWLGIRQVQTDERFFEAPKTFDPTRWDGELTEEIHEYAFAPFGGGPRLCIGRQFALTEAKLALAIIGRNYQLIRAGQLDESGKADRSTNIPDPPLTADMTLRLTPGTEFYLSSR